MVSPNSQLLRAALRYAAIGLRVLPIWGVTGSGCACGSTTCSSPGKHPLGELVPNGVRDASTDSGIIRRWWSQFPNANIGMATGSKSGIAVLDIDGDEGERSLQCLQDQHGALPTTTEQRTGRGRHLVFRIDGNLTVRNSVSRLGQGLDIRGEEGYVVVAPSRHVSGTRYEWIGEPLADVASLPCFPSLPTELHRQHALQRASLPAPISDDDARAEIQTAANSVRAAPQGTRNETLNRQAFQLGRQLGPDSEHLQAARDALRHAASEAGLNANEIDGTLRSGLEAGFRNADVQAERRAVLSTGSEVEIARTVIEQLGERHAEVAFLDGVIHVFDETHWTPLDPDALRRRIQAFDGAHLPSGRALPLSSRMITGVLREIPAMLEQRTPPQNPPMGVACRSGFVRIDDDGATCLEPHDSSHGRRHILEAAWPPCPSVLRRHSLLMRLLTGCFAGDSDIDDKIALISEIAGATALGCASRLPDPKAVILLGQSAGNGKSQILELLRGLVPSEASSSIPLALLGDQAHLAELSGKALNAADELDARDVRQIGFLKRAVTGEPVVARRLYCNPVQFRPLAQHVFAANRLPRIHGGFDAGLQRRIVVMTFNRRIPEDERIPAIGRRIVEEEPERLLAFAVAGARQLIRCHRFTEPESSRRNLAEWFLRDDPVRAWVEEGQVEESQSESTQASLRTHELHDSFLSWAQGHGLTPGQVPNTASFTRRLQELRPGCGYRRMSHGGEFQNLRLAPRPARRGTRPQS